MTPFDIAVVLRGAIFGKDFPVVKHVYDGSNNLIYTGIAPRRSLTSQPSWYVFKFIYDGSNNNTDVQSTEPNQIFDNYLTLTYA